MAYSTSTVACVDYYDINIKASICRGVKSYRRSLKHYQGREHKLLILSRYVMNCIRNVIHIPRCNALNCKTQGGYVSTKAKIVEQLKKTTENCSQYCTYSHTDSTIRCAVDVVLVPHCHDLILGKATIGKHA